MLIIKLLLTFYEAYPSGSELCRYATHLPEFMPLILTYLSGGKETTAMARLLGNDAHLISYGAMSKQPLSLPVSLFIFKNLTCHGYWLRRWYSESTPEDREKVMAELVNLMKEKKVTSIILVFHTTSLLRFQLVAPEHEIVTITVQESDDMASKKIKNVIRAVSAGGYGKKVLLRIESKDE